VKQSFRDHANFLAVVIYRDGTSAYLRIPKSDGRDLRVIVGDVGRPAAHDNRELRSLFHRRGRYRVERDRVARDVLAAAARQAMRLYSFTRRSPGKPEGKSRRLGYRYATPGATFDQRRHRRKRLTAVPS
jgi:hypothetical protein